MGEIGILKENLKTHIKKKSGKSAIQPRQVNT